MAVVRVTSKGQATIPKELRDRMGIRAPGEVVIREEDGRLVLEPVHSLEDAVARARQAFAGKPTAAELRRENARAEDRAERRHGGKARRR